MGKPSLDRLQELLECHENLLHAETQAISARHLDTIEDILKQKDESMERVLEEKNRLKQDTRSDDEMDRMIDRVLELQQRNAVEMKKLVDYTANLSKSDKDPKATTSNSDQRLRRAYLRNVGGENTNDLA